MKNKKYSIVYSSLTGNTRMLADAVHEALPQDECEYFGEADTVIPSSELVRVVIQHFLKTIVVQFVFEVVG